MVTTDTLALAGFLAVCFAAASSGAFFTPGAWYDALRKPSWNPPKWLFPPAWTLLFVMMAVSGWLAWRAGGFTAATAPAFAVYGLQLVLNAGWSALFFGLRRMDLAFAEVLFLWLAIAATIALFAPISSAAAWLLVPYLAWVSFAAFLNFTTWRLNTQASPAR